MKIGDSMNVMIAKEISLMWQRRAHNLSGEGLVAKYGNARLLRIKGELNKRAMNVNPWMFQKAKIKITIEYEMHGQLGSHEFYNLQDVKKWCDKNPEPAKMLGYVKRSAV